MLPDLDDEENQKKPDVKDAINKKIGSVLEERSQLEFGQILKEIKTKFSLMYFWDFIHEYELFQIKFEEELKDIHGRMEFLFRMIQASGKKKKSS